MVGLKDCIKWKFPINAYDGNKGAKDRPLKYYINFIKDKQTIEGISFENEWMIRGVFFERKEGKLWSNNVISYDIVVEDELKRIHGEGFRFELWFQSSGSAEDGDGIFVIDFDL